MAEWVTYDDLSNTDNLQLGMCVILFISGCFILPGARVLWPNRVSPFLLRFVTVTLNHWSGQLSSLEDMTFLYSLTALLLWYPPVVAALGGVTSGLIFLLLLSKFRIEE